MPFQPIATDSLPKRMSRGREFDQASADALLAIVTVAGQSASDGETFKSDKEARTAAGKARRLLIKVAPDPDLVKSRVYETEKGSGNWHWAVSIGNEKPAKKGSAKAK
jgi:hypothetical protein